YTDRRTRRKLCYCERTMLRATLSVLALCACTALAETPTFTKNIAPILFDRCAQCHRPGDIGPMPLLTYEQVRPWSTAIRDAVLNRRMPPWFADPAHGTFRNDRRLSDAQVDSIRAWVAAGSPKGDINDMPPAPKFAEGWSFTRPPDLVVEMPIDV